MRGEEAELFRAFVVERTDALMRLGYVLTGDRHQAEDLVQTALVKTVGRWSAIHRPEGGLIDVEAYVRKVMYHEQVSVWRRLRRPIRPDVPRVVAVRPDSSSQVDLRLVLRDALLKLTLKQRTIVAMRYYEDLSETQVAEILGVSVGTVRSQTAKALKRLRELVPESSELWTATAAN